MKRVRFWGTRGSLPVALTAPTCARSSSRALRARARPPARQRVADLEAILAGLPFAAAGTYGGHSSCVADRHRRSRVLRLRHGQRPAALRPGGDWRGATAIAQTFHVFMSHLHWDHIMGLPFFVPAYIPGQPRRIYGSHARARGGAAAPAGRAVVSGRLLDLRRDDIEFVHLEPGRHARGRRHEGHDDAAAPRRRLLRLSLRGAAARSSSTRPTPSTSSTTRARPSASSRSSSDADLVIFDAMYSLADAISVKADWGHSSNIVGVELCQMAEARGTSACSTTSRCTTTQPIDARARRDAAPRGDHATGDAARASPRPTTAWKSRCERRAAAPGPDGAPDRTHRASSASSVLVVAGAVLICGATCSPTSAAVGMVRRVSVARAAPARSRCRSPSSRSTRRASPAVGQWPWPRTRAGRSSWTRSTAPAGGDRARHPDARSRRAVARAAVSSATAAGPPRWSPRCAACPRTTRCWPARLRARRRVLAFAGTPEPPACRCARRRSRSRRPEPHGDADRELAVVRLCRRADQHRRARSPASGRGLISVDPDARHRPPHPARRQRRGHARADARHRDAARRRSTRPRMRLNVAGSDVDRPGGRRARACRPRRTARFASTTRTHRADRFVSAIDVLEGQVDPARLRSKLVLIGVDRARPARLPEHADRRAHARQRDPCPAPREPATTARCCTGRAGRRASRRCSSWCSAGCWSMATPRWKPRNAALLMLLGVLAPAALAAFMAFIAPAPAARRGDARRRPDAAVRRRCSC